MVLCQRLKNAPAWFYLEGFLSNDTYATKMTDYGHILYVLNALMFFIPMNLAHQTPT